MGTSMTQKRLLIPLIAVLFAVGVQQSYAEEQTVNVPFAPDDEKDCYYTYSDDRFNFSCYWHMYPTPEEIVIIAESDPELVPEHIVTVAKALLKELEKESVPEEPVIRTEQQIKVEGIITAREQLEFYWKGTKTIQELCFGGTERESQIFEQYATIDVKRPNDNRPLQSNPQYKYEMILSEICKAEYVLNFKINNPSRTLPGEGEQTEFVVTAVLPEDAQAKYDEAKMYDFFAQQSIQFAEEFQCSIAGKQQGHCPSAIGDMPVPEPTISKEGKAMLNEYNAYLETGLTELPFKEPKEEFVPTTALDQYIDAYGISEEELKEWYESRNP